MSGFDCQFTEEPPKYLQCYCPICLLILREPFLVDCCGKSFCRACIQKIEAKKKSCPTCNQAKFDFIRNLGLQQPLYGFRVFCSNKEGGCGWQGELGQLDKHLNVNPHEDKQFVGCAYTNIKCLFCGKLCLRGEIEDHQTSQCSQRPFTCEMCDDYESTYEDVVTSHAPECKCRPVECPNSCGASDLQHQHTEEHVSSQCPLTPVECEFSDAGCDAKVYRRDLSSHLSDNMITHMSLLARENRKLKQQLKTQEQQLKTQEQQLKTQEQQLREEFKRELVVQDKKHEQMQKESLARTLRVPPLLLNAELQNTSEPFYSHAGGYKLQLETQISRIFTLKFTLLESEFAVRLPCKLQITAKLLNQSKDTDHITVKYTLDSNQNQDEGYQAFDLRVSDFEDYSEDFNFKFQIIDVLIL